MSKKKTIPVLEQGQAVPCYEDVLDEYKSLMPDENVEIDSAGRNSEVFNENNINRMNKLQNKTIEQDKRVEGDYKDEAIKKYNESEKKKRSNGNLFSTGRIICGGVISNGGRQDSAYVVDEEYTKYHSKRMEEVTEKIEKRFASNVTSIISDLNLSKVKLAEDICWLPSKAIKLLNIGKEDYTSVAKHITLGDAYWLAKNLGCSIDTLLNESLERCQFCNTHFFSHEYTVKSCLESIFNDEGAGVWYNVLMNDLIKVLYDTLNVSDQLFNIYADPHEQKEPLFRRYRRKKEDSLYEYTTRYYPDITIEQLEQCLPDNERLMMKCWFDLGNKCYAIGINYFSNDNDYERRKRKKEYYQSLVESLIEKEEVDQNYKNSEKIGVFWEAFYEEALYYQIYKYDETNWDTNGQDVDEKFIKIFKKYKKTLDLLKEDKFISPTGYAISTLPDEYCGSKCDYCGIESTFPDERGNQFFYNQYLFREVLPNTVLATKANIMCLCPDCYAKLYHGNNSQREEMIVKVYQSKLPELISGSINISLAKLLSDYEVC